MKIERIGNKNYKTAGYAIIDKNWPCGDLYDISGQDFKGEFHRENIKYLLKEPKDYKLCQDEHRLHEWLDKNYDNVINYVYPDGDFYIGEVLQEIK